MPAPSGGPQNIKILASAIIFNTYNLHFPSLRLLIILTRPRSFNYSFCTWLLIVRSRFEKKKKEEEEEEKTGGTEISIFN